MNEKLLTKWATSFSFFPTSVLGSSTKRHFLSEYAAPWDSKDAADLYG